MARRVAVLQSSYLPWKGYFDLVHDVDLFVFYDDVQYSKGSWRNRNRIKTPRGLEWITVPVGPRESRLICEVELPADPAWAADHARRIEGSYREAPFFADHWPLLQETYREIDRFATLSQLNRHLAERIAREALGIRTDFADSRDLRLAGRKQERLLDLLAQVGAEVYVSGPAARSYIEPERFAAAGIELVWKDYAGYPEYPQLHPPFRHEVSIVDLLFHLGPAAPRAIWGWREGEGTP
jgi:hypothetical protein